MPNATTTSTTFVCPVIGDLGLSGSASGQTLQQVTVDLPYDDLYEITLDASHSLALLTSFQLSGNGATFAVDWSDTTGDKFKGEMQYIIDNAQMSSKTLATRLDDGVDDMFNSAFNGIANILESGVTYSTSVDSDGGANDMRTKLNGANREIIAQQIPEDHYNAYTLGVAAGVSGENSSTTALPLFVGDKLVFIFDTLQTLEVRLTPTKVEGANPDTGATAVAGASTSFNPYGASMNSMYSYSRKKIAFQVTVAGAEGDAVGDKIAALEA